MKLYYSFKHDIMCIVDGKKIYKYIGAPSMPANSFVSYLAYYEFGFEHWYKAKTPPEKFEEFVLIGEFKS